ncbi:DUF4124 domain-containing protein [Hydrogenophaga sp. MI9]|uniref:DUF4124 domain-containing protein n=1 Tax=Hydrogenophaga sp. MI9 TaxID=3453719 RepID=UPI003EE92B3B
MAKPALRPLAALALAVMLCGSAHAGVFKCKGPTGATVFQDSECGPGSQSLVAPKTDAPAVDLTQPLEKRFKTPEEKSRVMAAMKIAGMELAMRKSIDFCKTRAAEHVAGIEQVYDEWRKDHIMAITASDQLIEKYTSMKERSDAFTEVGNMLDQSLNLRAGNDVARNVDNCKSAPAKLKSFLANRHTDAYSAVGKPR